MKPEPEIVAGQVDGVGWEVRPEWFAGRHWWRVHVAGHPKVLVRYQQYALQVAAPLAADEARFRRDGAAPA